MTSGEESRCFVSERVATPKLNQMEYGKYYKSICINNIGTRGSLRDTENTLCFGIWRRCDK